MSAEVHGSFREMVDRGLAAGLSAEEERALAEHVAACAPCREYASANQRAIAGLKGFSLEAGPGLNARVMAAVRARAEERETRRRWTRLSVVALVLTVLGTVVDLRVGQWAAGVLDLRPVEVQHGLMALWIVPSFGLLLLFPLLPLLSAKRHEKGRTI